MDITIKTFDALSNKELYSLLKLRSAVFVVEQECIYQDLDGKDDKALHVLGKIGDEVVAYLRLFRPGAYFENAAIGRVVVANAHRKKGFAKTLMQTAIHHLTDEMGVTKIELSAQVYLKEFYNDLGFLEKGTSYLEDGIPHIKMVYA